MRSCFMIILKLGSKYSPQVFFAEDDHMIETLPANSADEAFYIRVAARVIEAR